MLLLSGSKFKLLSSLVQFYEPRLVRRSLGVGGLPRSRVLLAACSLQLAACSLQLAAYSLQLTACSLQLAAYSLQLSSPIALLLTSLPLYLIAFSNNFN
jgi:hypothetical protein